jgi:translation initiation factor IF-2
VHINGKTAHAYFVDGGRVTAWGRGRAPSKMAVPEEVIVEKRKVQAEKVAAAAKRAEAAAEAEKKAKAEAEKARLVEPVATKPQAKPEKPEVSSSEKPTSETPPAVTEKQSEPSTTASPAKMFDEPTPIPAKPEIASQKSESTQLPTPEPSATPPAVNEPPRQEVATEPKEEVAGTSEISQESSPASTKKESSRDVSLNSLVGPPSSLRTTTETSTPKTESETSTSRDDAPLTETEAINLADTEARRQGAPLDYYQRPKVDHSAVKGKWSLFYGLKEGQSAAERGSPFTVTVEDKTKKVEIRK